MPTAQKGTRKPASARWRAVCVSSASGGAFCDSVAVRAQASLLGRASDERRHPAGSLAYANRRRLYRPTIASVQAQLTCRRGSGACLEEVDSARGTSLELGWNHGVEQTVSLRATAVGTRSRWCWQTSPLPCRSMVLASRFWLLCPHGVSRANQRHSITFT